jgi:hypothetical protein
MSKTTTFQGITVSRSWNWLLTDARRAGIDFKLNSGKRTIAGQKAMVAKHGLWSQSNRTGAAAPNPRAPHIKHGRANHAIDVDMYAGDGENALQAWLRKQGLNVVNNVPGEPWHLDPVDHANFLKVARRHRPHKKRG